MIHLPPTIKTDTIWFSRQYWRWLSLMWLISLVYPTESACETRILFSLPFRSSPFLFPPSLSLSSPFGPSSHGCLLSSLFSTAAAVAVGLQAGAVTGRRAGSTAGRRTGAAAAGSERSSSLSHPGMQHVGSLSHRLAVGKVLLSPLLSDDVTEGRLQWAPIGLSPWRHLMLPRTPPRHARWRGSPGRRHHPGFGSQGVQGVLAKLRSWPPRSVTPPDSQVAPGLDSPPPPRAMHGSATA